MAGGPDANDILMELTLHVDSENPITREVTLRLNELAETVASGSPDVRDSVLEMGAYAVVCRAWIYCCYSGSNSNSLAPGAKFCRNAVLKALCALTPGHPDIIDDVGWQIISQALDKTLPDQTQILVLKLIRNIFIKAEENREQFCWYQDLLEPLLALTAKSKISDAFLLEWCYAVKALVLNDDVRETCNRAAERKKAIAHSKILPNLASRLNIHTPEDEDTSVEAMNAIIILLTSMAVSEDLILSIDSGNVIPGIHNLFKHRAQNKTLMRNTLSLLRRLCVLQQVRDKAAAFALMKYVVDALNSYQDNKAMVDEAMQCCACMTLKNACQVAQFIVKGGLQATLQIMNTYLGDAHILKLSCLTLRNVLESGEEANGKEKIKELGFTMLLNSLMSTTPQLQEFYIVPLLRELGFSSTSFLEEHAFTAGQENVPLEPKRTRRSVVVDEENIK